MTLAERSLADSQSLVALAEGFRDKRYRDTYVAIHTRNVLARQMRNFRGAKSQADFGTEIGKRQTVVSRLENPAYGAWTLRTMFEVARKLNVAVFARFVDFPTFLKYSERNSEDNLKPSPYDSEALERSVLPDNKIHERYWAAHRAIKASNIIEYLLPPLTINLGSGPMTSLVGQWPAQPQPDLALMAENAQLRAQVVELTKRNSDLERAAAQGGGKIPDALTQEENEFIEYNSPLPKRSLGALGRVQ